MVGITNHINQYNAFACYNEREIDNSFEFNNLSISTHFIYPNYAKYVLLIYCVHMIFT